jgi:hypothetical protein
VCVRAHVDVSKKESERKREEEGECVSKRQYLKAKSLRRGAVKSHLEAKVEIWIRFILNGFRAILDDVLPVDHFGEHQTRVTIRRDVNTGEVSAAAADAKRATVGRRRLVDRRIERHLSDLPFMVGLGARLEALEALSRKLEE